MAGRPIKLTKELQKRICGLIRLGNFPDVAARACGVGRATFFEWIARGRGTHPDRGPTKILAAFAAAVDESLALAETWHVARIHEYARGMIRRDENSPVEKSKMTSGQALASQWSLSRRFSERWGPRPALVVHPDEAPAESAAEIEAIRPKITIIYAPEVADDAPGVPALGALPPGYD